MVQVLLFTFIEYYTNHLAENNVILKSDLTSFFPTSWEVSAWSQHLRKVCTNQFSYQSLSGEDLYWNVWYFPKLFSKIRFYGSNIKSKTELCLKKLNNSKIMLINKWRYIHQDDIILQKTFHYLIIQVYKTRFTAVCGYFISFSVIS